MMSSSWRDFTVEMRIACEQKIHSWNFHGRHGCRCDPKLGQEMGELSDPPCREFWNRKEDKRLRQKETVAVPELQRIQEPHRVFQTGHDVFAQVRFPN